MIVGATPDSDFQIMRLSESLYKKYRLKRVFYSAYIPVSTSALLPRDQPPPLLREHRLYQTDWLLRYYGFRVEEILDEQHPTLDPLLDPKCNWALHHLDQFPVEVNRADKEMLLRIPGVGLKSTERILTARRDVYKRQHQHYVARFHGDIRAAAHGETHVRGSQSRSVVDAVPRHGHHLSLIHI